MPKIRYPFDPARLDAYPEPLAELARGLEIKLLEEICSRLKIAGQLNEVTVQDIRALRSHGIDLKEIKKAIAEYADISEKELNKLLDDVVKRNQKYYTDVIDLAKVTKPKYLVNERDIEAIRRQTWAAYKNLTQSMGFLMVQGGRLKLLPPAEAYMAALDSAELQVMSGAISYNQAITSAIRQLADSGIKTVDYESGHVDSVDVAVRRAVMTGVNQLNQKYREQSMDYLETDLVETTAHLGARNIQRPGEPDFVAHTNWQGKVFRWKGHGGEERVKLSDGHKKEPIEPQTIRSIARNSDSNTETKNHAPINAVGKIDKNKYSVVSDKIRTDEVIITEERIQHIKERHPNDFERYSRYLKDMVENPQYILEANKPNTALILKRYVEDGEQFQLILRLACEGDNPEYKNSIITFLKISDRTWERYIRNKKTLYKSE